MHLGPWKDLGGYKWVPGRTWSRGDIGRPKFGELARRQRGVGGGKGRGRRGAPVGGLWARGDGRTGLAGVKKGAAEGLAGGGSASAAVTDG